MTRVPLKDLKQRLSYWTETAARGEVVEVTKHNRPFVRLVSAWGPNVTVGSRVGKASLEPGPVKLKGEKAFKTLMEDRADR